jgi:hypothetical protein
MTCEVNGILTRRKTMKAKTIDEIPNDKWGLDRLGKFCVERRKRSAMDTVLIGRALALAKVRCKRDGRDFTSWKKEHGFSNATVSRYMRLAESCKTDADFERLKSIGPLDAYVEAGIEAPREQTPPKTLAKESKAGTRSAKNNDEPRVPSWAVADADSPDTEHDDESESIDLVPKNDCISHELREVVPWQVEQLKGKVAFLLEQDVEELRAARPAKACDRKKVASEISALVEMLSRLAAMLRAEPASQSIQKITKESKKVA